MRLLTRSDFDGLICAVLLKHIGMMDRWEFVHPKDVQDGLIKVTADDILANVPYSPGVGLWFDHHSSEKERLNFHFKFNGASQSKPSCARVIWDYYGGHQSFPESFDQMMAYVDKCDSAQFTVDEILNPKGWVLLSFIMDPRTGLGRYQDYRISNYNLMMKMVDWCASLTVEDILAKADVQERVTRYFDQDKLSRDQLKRCTIVKKNLAVIDFRNEAEIFTGNRFLVYSLFPETNISMHVIWGKQKQNVVFSVGHSILNRTSTIDVGNLMVKYGGGGHERVGTCQINTEDAERIKKEIITYISSAE